MAALHFACSEGNLPLVKALVEAGANPVLRSGNGRTPHDSQQLGQKDVVAYLLSVPAARSALDASDNCGRTALYLASDTFRSFGPTVELLLAAGADPNGPPDGRSPLELAEFNLDRKITSLLRHAAAAADFTRRLFKFRALLDAAVAVPKARSDARGKGEPATVQWQKAVAAAPTYLKARVEREQPLPRVELRPARKREESRITEARATVAFAVGFEDGGVKYPGLPPELFEELIDYMLPAWADKGPDA